MNMKNISHFFDNTGRYDIYSKHEINFTFREEIL